MVKNLPANTWDAGSSPGPGKIPHAMEQLSPYATTTEPTRLGPVFCNKRSHHNKKPTLRNEV